MNRKFGRYYFAFLTGWVLAGVLEFYQISIMVDVLVLVAAALVIAWVVDHG